MPNIYSYAYSEYDTSIWWGIQTSKETYFEYLGVESTQRLFVKLSSNSGQSFNIAIVGFHEENSQIVFAPDWVHERLQCSYGDEIQMELISDILPNASSLSLRPVSSETTAVPMFPELLTEALNKLGILQTGTLSVLLDPSLPVLHSFHIESMEPNSLCLADGEVNIEFLSASDTEPRVPIYNPASEPPIDFESLITPMQRDTRFQGVGRRLG